MVVSEARSEAVTLCQSDIGGTVCVEKNVDALLSTEIGDPNAGPVHPDPAEEPKLVAVALPGKPLDFIGSPEKPITRH